MIYSEPEDHCILLKEALLNLKRKCCFEYFSESIWNQLKKFKAVETYNDETRLLPA